MSDFSKIDFGEISGEAERQSNPVLLTSGFVDIKSIETEAVNGRRFLFLGYKGSGKSSIGERLDLVYGDKHDSFVKKISLADFPFTPFSKIVKGDIEPEAKFPTAWSWILLIYILESFGRDTAASHPDDRAFTEAQQAFKDMGLSPAANPASIVRTTTKKTFTLKSPYDILGYQREGGEQKSADSIFNFVDAIKRLCSQIRSPNRHILIIDGLDEILSERSIQYKSLYALMHEAAAINSFFANNDVPFKIIVLCRTDLFDRISGPNKNKVRQPYAVDIDWYHDPRDPDKSALMRGANLRAKVSLGRDVDIFAEFLPSRVYNTPTKQYFLDMTRHTPRDFFQLLTHIKKRHKSGKMKEEDVKSGFRDYSTNYFYPEIQDELSGYASPGNISDIFLALGTLRKRELSFGELFGSWKTLSSGNDEDTLISVCKALFECGAIGNVQNDGKETHYTFKYRNRLSGFHRGNRIMLHRGLWKAMNVT